MNELTVQDENTLAISDSTKELIKVGVSKSALQAYGRALVHLTYDSRRIWMTLRLRNTSRSCASWRIVDHNCIDCGCGQMGTQEPEHGVAVGAVLAGIHREDKDRT